MDQHFTIAIARPFKDWAKAQALQHAAAVKQRRMESPTCFRCLAPVDKDAKWHLCGDCMVHMKQLAASNLADRTLTDIEHTVVILLRKEAA